MSKHSESMAIPVWLLVAAVMVVFLFIGIMDTRAAGETCTTSDGQTYTVPPNKQIVLIPKLWNPDHLSYCVPTGGKILKPEVKVEPPVEPVNKCEGKLVISPSYCDPATGKVT